MRYRYGPGRSVRWASACAEMHADVVTALGIAGFVSLTVPTLRGRLLRGSLEVVENCELPGLITANRRRPRNGR